MLLNEAASGSFERVASSGRPFGRVRGVVLQAPRACYLVIAAFDAVIGDGGFADEFAQTADARRSRKRAVSSPLPSVGPKPWKTSWQRHDSKNS
jgi:hypothetical protein